MMMRQTALALLLGICGLYLFIPNISLAQNDSATVLCHDSARGIVQRVLRGQCAGVIVTDSQAEAIRLREQHKRAERINNIEDKARTGSGNNKKRASIRYGTAFPVDTTGHFLTARHVIADCTTLALDDQDGHRFAAEELARHSDADIALLFAPDLKLTALPAAHDEPVYGDPLYTIGYPQEKLPRIRPAYLGGTMQAVSNENSPIRYLAFRAAIRSGNSGGPLFNAQGALVGMVIAKINTVAVFEASGAIVHDIGFAIGLQSLGAFLREQGVTLAKAPAHSLPADPADLQSFIMRVICTI